MSASVIENLKFLEPRTFTDNRGYFRETFRQEYLKEITGRDLVMVQGNESFSVANVLRGLHFQKPPQAQAKLVRVACGNIFDVAVDMRPESKTYKQWCGYELSGENGCQLFIPEGFAHGFLVLSQSAVVSYLVSGYYAPVAEGGFRWNDPDIDIKWPLNGQTPVISDKDAMLPAFSELGKIF